MGWGWWGGRGGGHRYRDARTMQPVFEEEHPGQHRVPSPDVPGVGNGHGPGLRQAPLRLIKAQENPVSSTMNPESLRITLSPISLNLVSLHRRTLNCKPASLTPKSISLNPKPISLNPKPG